MTHPSQHADALDAINADLTKQWHQAPNGQLANIIYTIRRATDHLREQKWISESSPTSPSGTRSQST